jgi:hypothetical protein
MGDINGNEPGLHQDNEITGREPMLGGFGGTAEYLAKKQLSDLLESWYKDGFPVPADLGTWSLYHRAHQYGLLSRLLYSSGPQEDK